MPAVLDKNASLDGTCTDIQGVSTPSLRRSFGWTFIANVFYSGCQWASLVFLAKMTSTEQVGLYSLSLAVATPLAMLSNLSLRALVVTDISGAYHVRDVVALRYLSGSFALLVGAAIAFAFGYDRHTTAMLLLMTVAQTTESLSDTYYGLLQRRERMDRVATSMIARSVASITALALGVAFTKDVMYGVAAMAFARVVVLLFYDAQPRTLSWRRDGQPLGNFSRGVFANLRPRWNPRRQAAIVWKIAPLAIVGVLTSLNGNIPRYFVESSCGHKTLGVFVALAMLPSVGMTIISALGQAATARLARAFALYRLPEYKALLARLLLISLLLGASGLAVTALAGSQILRLLYGPAYAAYSPLLLFLAVAGTLGYLSSVLGNGLTAACEFGVQLPILFSVTLILLASSAILIPRYGVSGGALAMIVAAVLQLIMLGALTYRSMTRRSRLRAALVVPSRA